MLGDQLTRDERIRLESLNQAIASSMTMRAEDSDELVARAERFEMRIRNGK